MRFVLQIVHSRISPHASLDGRAWNSDPGGLLLLPQYSDSIGDFPFFQRNDESAEVAATGGGQEEKFTAVIFTPYSTSSAGQQQVFTSALFRLVRNVSNSANVAKVSQSRGMRKNCIASFSSPSVAESAQNVLSLSGFSSFKLLSFEKRMCVPNFETGTGGQKYSAYRCLACSVGPCFINEKARRRKEQKFPQPTDHMPTAFLRPSVAAMQPGGKEDCVVGFDEP